MGKKIAFLAFFVFFLLLFPTQALAVSCRDTPPATPPVLLSAASSASESVTLTWKEAGDPRTYYLIAYGENPLVFDYGVPEIGARDATSYTIDHLKTGTKYYFKVRAGNGCKPGKFSNKLTAIPGGGTKMTTLPNLSMYKRTEDVSKSALFGKKTEVHVGVKAAEIVKRCTYNCNALVFLAGEFAALLIYFLISSKVGFVKPFFSILIPLIAYFSFYHVNKNCTSMSLLCRSFTALDILVFLVIFILYKKLFLHRKI